MLKVASGCMSRLEGLVEESRKVTVEDDVVEVIERGSGSSRASFRGMGRKRRWGRHLLVGMLGDEGKDGF